MPKQLRPVKPEDLYALQQVYDCELSPDGEWLASTVVSVNRKENKNYGNIWVTRTNGRERRQFTQGEHFCGMPRFSPDGKFLAFLSNRSGSMQLHLMHTAGGEAWQLTKDDGSVHEFCWAPDSKSMVFSFVPRDEDEKQQDPKSPKAPLVRHVDNLLYKNWAGGFFPKTKCELRSISVKGTKSRLVFKDEFHNLAPVFTPDGKHVLFVSNKKPDYELQPWVADIWRIRADGKGRPSMIDTHAGPAYWPVVSPNGKSLAFMGQSKAGLPGSEQNNELFVVPLKGGKPRSLSARLDRQVGSLGVNDTWGTVGQVRITWSPDSKELYAPVTTDGSVELYRFDVENGGGAPVCAEPGVVLDYGVDFERDKLYCSLSTIENPGDLYSRKLKGGALKQLTKLNARWLNRRDLGAVDEFWCKGGDGNPVHGWVMTPPDYNPRKEHPAILYIHGGPMVAYVRAFFHEFQYLAGLGYCVLYCNPRGSDGYGLKHLSAITPRLGDKDYSDLMKFTDACLRRYSSIDRRRLGVAGGSYGGYMTNWIIGQTQRFKAAVSQRGLSNFLSYTGSAAFGYNLHRVWFRNATKTPWEDVKRYLAMSPMTHLSKARTPTLLIHSENDTIAPMEQSEQVYVQLKLQGVDTEFLRFPEEGHELSRSGRADRRIERLKRISGWFDRYLK